MCRLRSSKLFYSFVQPINKPSLKLIKKIVLIVLILTGVGFIVVIDMADRNKYSSRHISKEEIKEFTLYKTVEEVQDAYKRNYGNPQYLFPRGNVEKVKIYKNQFLISRISSKTLSEVNATATLAFLNNPDNFDWGETTWSLKESEYILRFFDSQDNEIGKVWLCIEGCGMTESIPFSPNMKFGALSTIGRTKLNKLLMRILEN
jgi:hypothetical protein